MKLTLTDGHCTCVALGMEKIPQLSLNTPPGTKVELQGTVPVQHGFLLLNSSNVKILGGRVDKLVQGWELKRTLAKHSRNPITGGEGGPPPFIPFGQRHRQQHDSKHEHRSRDNFKSLETSKEKKEADGDFEQQRQATIAEVLQVKGDGKPKAFGGGNINKVPDRDVAQIMEMGFTAEQASVALKANNNNIEEALNSLLNVQQEPKGRGYQDKDGRGPRNGEYRRSDGRDQDRDSRGNQDGGDSGRGEYGGRGEYSRGDYGGRGEYSSRGDYGGRSRGRGAGPPRQLSAEDKPPRGRGRRGRDQEEDGYDEHPSKPSAPATLFDFLTSKMPAKDDAQTHSTMQTEEKPNKEPEHWNAQPERRGPPNLPPRLLKQQKLQEEQRGQRYDRDRGQPRGPRGGPDGPRGSQNRNYSSDSSYNSRGPGDDRGKSRGNRNMGRNPDSGRQNQNRGYQNSGSSQNSRAENSDSGQGGDKRTYSSQKGRQENSNYYNQNRRSDKNLNYNQVDNSLQNRSGRMDNQGRDRENQYQDYSSVQAEQNRRQQNVPSSAPRQAVSMQQQQQQYQILTRVPPQQVTEPSQSQVTYTYQPAPDMTQQNHMYQVTSQQPPDMTGQTYYQMAPQDANQHNHTYQMATQVSADQGQYTTTYQMTQNFQSMTLAGQQDYTMQNTIQGYTMDPNMMATYDTKGQLAQRSQPYATAAPMANTNMTTSMAAMQMDMRPPRQWKPQDYCMAKYWMDGKFYRAVVESPSQDNQTILVYFHDYGNTEQVMLTDVRTIPKQAWDSNQFHQPTAAAGPGAAVAGCIAPVSVAASMGTTAYVTREQPYPNNMGNMEFRRGGGGVVYRMPDQRRQPQRIPQQLYVPPGQRTRPM